MEPRRYAGRWDRLLSRFRNDRHASVAVWIGIAMVPLVLMSGAAIDVGRAVNVRAQLQRAADSAALAGASAYTSSATAAAATTAATNFMNGAVANLRGGATVTYTVTLSTVTASSSTSVYKVTVAANAQLKTTIMSLVSAKMPVAVAATADNPVYTITISLSSFASSAADSDTISYYVVPSDNGTPTALTKMYSNESTNNAGSVSITLTAAQSIGFALTNVTGDILNYGSNGYSGRYESSHYFYSHMAPPSLLAYPSVTRNCSLQVVTTLTALVSGICPSATPALGVFNCASAGTTPYYFAWNDMGGPIDDRDYNDAVYKVSCAKSSSSAVNGVVLEK